MDFIDLGPAMALSFAKDEAEKAKRLTEVSSKEISELRERISKLEDEIRSIRAFLVT